MEETDTEKYLKGLIIHFRNISDLVLKDLEKKKETVDAATETDNNKKD